MLRVQGLGKSFGGRQLFEGVDWHIPHQGRYGFVGPNGVGKTTLFRILVGELEPDEGDVIHPKGVELGYLPQEATVEADKPLLAFVMEGAQSLLEMEKQIEQMTLQLETTPNDMKLQETFTALQTQFEQRGGYKLKSLARQIVVGMGFGQDDFDKSLQSFSGGWRMKALLCQLLLGQPHVLLLDEPTNHLDLESIEWLEQFLKGYQGTVIVISHDRFFLNHIVDAIVELTPKALNTHPGSYDHYLKARQQRIELQIKTAAEQQKEIERIEAFVERFRYKATKAKQVQSREKRLAQLRAELVEVETIAGAAMQFSFPVPERMGRVVVDAKGLTKSFGDKTLYSGVDLQIERGQKVAFVGPNGAGKTTLLNMIAGLLEPDSGAIGLGHQVSLSHFAQHSVDQLDLSRTILQEMQASAIPETYGQIRNILGAFGFSGDAVEKQISVLSGGEKTRLALAKLLLVPAGCLLLDEPTNHLDMVSREVLEHALQSFEGAVCVISHDRYFLNQFVNKVIHIEQGQIIEYPGDYAYYQWKHKGVAEATPQETEDAPDLKSRKVQRQLLAQLQSQKQSETKSLRKKIQTIEQEIEQGEQHHQTLETLLADPQTYQRDDIGELTRAYKEQESQLEFLMLSWEEAQEALMLIEEKYVAQEEAIRQGR